MGEMISFLRPDGKPARGYLAQAQDPQAPGLVVIQEWWGLQDQIKAICDEFAKAGYHALAPDLFSGRVVPYHDVEQASREMNSLDFLQATDQEVRGAVLHFAKQGRRVGLTGFCMGGAITIIGAVRIPELSAAVCFYGLPPEAVASPQDIQAPIQCHFANQDDWCKPEVVDRFEAQLKQAGKTYEIYRYDAEHAFVNWQRQDVYDEQAKQLAWSRCLDFWQRYLR
jgi:carboxymethylenebutenolidase